MTRADLVLLVCVAVLLPAVYWAAWRDRGAGEAIEIRSGDRPPLVLSLHRDQQVKIGGRLGESVIEIQHGKAHFVASPCTSKVCIHSGWLDQSGQFAACLPNGVSLTVAGGKRRFDAINF